MRLLILLFISITSSVFSQEELNPILFQKKNTQKNNVLRSNDSFDSTFIYTSDTLQLPFFDEFSLNHFQKYVDDYTGATVTFDKRYKLLDVSNVPLNVNTRLTSQQTIRKTVNTLELTVVDELLPTTQIKVGNFSSYPPQYTEHTAYPPYIIYDTVNFPNPVDTVWLTEVDFFQDSATQFFAQLNDKSAFWLDSKAEHNYTNAVNPWTLGVVTFDGTDENGFPYQFGSTAIDYNDYLTSKQINLSSFDAADSVYFSFLYQPQGFNDEPESVDSLKLEFYAPDLSQWIQVWSVGGSPLHDFKKVHLKITNPDFFKHTFQFRFKNYSGVSGGIDQFHIDYVRLQAFSGYQDTLFKDFSVIYPLNTLLQDYTQVPWDHFKNNSSNKTTTNLKINLRNSSNVDENYLNGNIKIVNNALIDGSINILGQDLANGDINYFSNSIYESFHDVSSFYDFNASLTEDHQDFKVTFSAAAQFSNLAQNDSTIFTQRFYDVYAYDDGSAEAAYGPTGVQARLAYKFTPYVTTDSLVGVKIRFVPSVNDVTNDLFLLTVWNDNAGVPGDVIYEDDFLNPREPSYEYDDSLGFTNYYFLDFQRLPITGTFYVGWRQLEQQALNIGFDRNTNQSDKIFYSVTNGVTWSNTLFEGSLLMRPIFVTELNQDVSVNKLNSENNDFEIFPNPTKQIFQIKTNNSEFNGIKLTDVNGKVMFFSDKSQTSFNIEHFSNGIYFVQDVSTGKIFKILKN